MTRRFADRVAPAESGELRRAAAAGTVDGACAALELDPDDPLATLTDRPPSLWRALAAAARERGLEHPADDERRRLRTALDESAEEIGAADGDDAADAASDALAAARRRAAAAGTDVDRLRERAATLRGRLAEARERTTHDASDDADTSATADADATTVDSLRAEFEAATRALSEAETERVAADQALARAAERSRSVRDARERRLRLRDALANRRREARRDLAREVYPAFANAVAAFHSEVDPVDGRAADAEVGDDPGDFDGDAVVAHAAAIRIAERSDPVVVGVDRFVDATAARDWLCTPVVLVGAE
ncbi:hypothetical protein [Halobaculum magnesiiphilum]|uniref:Uncharacterized protein n=1 Tax=Halobaculum magnesiiphilum TaxID=1017351 RepID=A0A8T8WAB8_9EURY|nr:hypothetical protein [Halobaculum magnesiiphilum]QZP36694.1 hypothetical protein K6T50_10290 [Halobaculum magnesiiphilum]